MPDRAALDTPIGTLLLFANENGVTRIRFAENCENIESDSANPHLAQLLAELRGYFAGETKTFSVKLSPQGTPFQLSVWSALTGIPHGATQSYGQVAATIGNPRAVRAVGGANNRNPLPIVIPCHRVIGQDRSLVGYGGELWRKKWLLAHEGIELHFS